MFCPLMILACVKVGEGVRTWASPARVGLAAALAYSFVPVLQGAGMLMTIDAPYVACWAVACWAFAKALKHGVPTPGTEEDGDWGADAGWRASQ